MPGNGESFDKAKHLESFLKIGLDEWIVQNIIANKKVSGKYATKILNFWHLFWIPG